MMAGSTMVNRSTQSQAIAIIWDKGNREKVASESFNEIGMFGFASGVGC
jgi:hypothetical protein